MTQSIAPHGGALIRRLVNILEDAASRLPEVRLSPRAEADAALIAHGAYSPLAGFLEEADYASVVARRRLADGTLWPLPITLTVEAEKAQEAKAAGGVRLLDGEGTLRGILYIRSIYRRDRTLEAQEVYGTVDPVHPGVTAALEEPEWALGGTLAWLNGAVAPELPAWPEQTRAAFAERGWRRIVAFQTRNPVHRAHEYIQKAALETVDGLLLHPLVGPTKDDDLPAEVRLKSYRALLDGYFPKDRALLAVFPAPMRYAGPREALFHAIVRQNYGATHFIVGRDHAGVGRFYGPYDAHRIFDTLAPGDLRITPLFFDATFYCKACGSVASEKTCPHGKESQVTLSGTEVRTLLRAGRLPPPEFSRPEVARVLIEALQDRKEIVA